MQNNKPRDGSDANSPRADSPQRLAVDVVRIAASNDELRKKEIQRYYKSGEEHLKARQYKEALDDFNRVIALDGNHARAFARRGRAYLELRQYKEALADFNKALDLEKNNIYALVHRGIAYRELGQYEKAQADFKRVLALGYSRPWIQDQVRDLERKKEIQKYYKSGEENLKARQYEKARDDFNRVIALDGNDSGALAYRGRAYLELRQFNEALADLDKALDLNKNNLYALGHRGIAYRELGQYEKAQADFKRVLPRHSRPWVRDQVRDLERKKLIQRYYDAGKKNLKARQYKKARRDFNRVIALDRNHAKAYAYRGKAYLELNQVKRALADFKRARHLGYSQSWILDQIRQYFEDMCQK